VLSLTVRNEGEPQEGRKYFACEDCMRKLSDDTLAKARDAWRAEFSLRLRWHMNG
jgi:hypothetical protein